MFGDAARKLQKDFATIPPPPFVSLEHDGMPVLKKNYIDNKDKFVFDFRSKAWDNFKFNKEEILKTLELHTTR